MGTRNHDRLIQKDLDEKLFLFSFAVYGINYSIPVIILDDFHANSPVKINSYVLIIFHPATKVFDQRGLEYNSVHDGCLIC